MTDETTPPQASGNPAESAQAEAEATPMTAAQRQGEQQTLQAAATRSRRAFLGLGLAGVAGVLGWRYLIDSPQRQNAPRDLRAVLDFNARLTKDYFRHTRLAPEFAQSRVQPARPNGNIGLGNDFDPSTWQLTVQGYAPQGTAARQQQLTLEQIKALPRVAMITEFKCIEGWSRIVQWAGVRLSDLLAHYPLATASGQAIANLSQPPADTARYVGMITPDQNYYVGLEMYAALHPQTLLAYELNGQPLTAVHGAPLRLATPLKYGVKQLKRIGTIFFADQRPADYWAEQGYDWSGEL